MELIPASWAVKVFGPTADWKFSLSKRVVEAQIAGLGVSTNRSSLARSNAMTVCGLISLGIGVT